MIKTDILFALACAVIITFASCTAATTVNSKIDRTIDLSSQLVKIVERIHIEGDPQIYLIKIDPSHKKRLAYIDSTINGQPLSMEEKPNDTYEINLAGQTKQQPLVVTSIYTKFLIPSPAQITQSERQLVRFQGLQTTLSPYLTRTITTKIKLPQSSRLESFTKASKMTTGSNKLTYGPFKDVQPEQAEPLSIHYENNTPFVAIEYLKRTIEISPWTRSINIVNDVKVVHIGAKLKGSFSRFEYQRDHSNGLNSVKNFVAEIPRTSRDIYYRDGIGNISTSNVKTSGTKTLLGLKPRFPLFGGWGTDFNLGYRVPIEGFVNEPLSGNNYRLSIPFADVMYENMYIEDATVRVILPAGSSEIEVISQAGTERLIDDLSYSYLDIVGRPVVVLKKQNIVAQHMESKPLIIRYNYSKIYMLQEPLLLLAAAVCALIMAALYSKLCLKNCPSPQISKTKAD